jgi:6-phosphofructokinase 2
LQDRGVEIVALSLGPRGLLVTWQHRAFHATTPPVQSISTVGAGDSVIAGMLYQLAAGGDLSEAVRWGAACGTATALTPGTELCKREGVLQILDSVILEELN